MIVGIDLGTTNSAIGVWRDGQAELIPNSLGHFLTPSAVGLDANGEVLVGLPARERQTTHSHLTVTAFKRYMGSRRATRLGKRDFLPEELSALVLRSLKADAEAFLGEPVTEAVITVPAYFSDKQRKATRRAGELAGLKVERLLNEPTAAALAYGIHRLDNESRFFVFDLGGGTFDVSILEIFEGIIEVRASTGDNRLGGEDFNDLLIKGMKEKFGKSWKVGPQAEKAHHQILRAAAEKARRALSERSPATMQIVWQDKEWEWTLTDADFEHLAKDLLERLREPVLRSLRDSDLRPDDLQEVVLVGGATRMPLVRRAVTKMFGRFPSQTVHPDEAVAIGAAVQAGLKARNEDLKEVAVTDVCPYSLGVDSAERGPNDTLRKGIYVPIIERNTTVPASRVKPFTTLQNNQPSIRFNIFQGESRYVEDNIPLGILEIPMPKGPAGQVWVECRFTYDVNGLIEIDLFVPTTGERRQLVIVDEDGPSGDDLEKQRAALAALKIHPRDADANRAALARAARCYENYLGEKRESIGLAMAQFESILESQDTRLVDRARSDLMAMLDAIDGESFL